MIRDIQVNPFNNEIITTALREYNKINYTIPTSANYPDLNPYMYCLFLDEVPFLDDRTNFPFVVKNASETITFTEVMTEPQSQYEFRIAPFGSLRPNCIQFHPSAAGMGIKVTYWGMGSVLSYVNYLSKAENLNDLLNKAIARTNLDVYSKSETYQRFTPVSEIFGLKISNNNTNPNTDLDFAVGWCFSDEFRTNPENSLIMKNTSVKTKKVNTTFAEGNNQGMLQSGQTFGANKSYHLYIIMKDNGTTDFLATQHDIAVSLPSGFTRKRRIGAIITNASSQIVQFNHFPEQKTYYYKNKILYYQSWATTETACYFYVPKGLNVRPIFLIGTGRAGNTSGTGYLTHSIRGIEKSFQTPNDSYPAFQDFFAEIGMRHDYGSNETPYAVLFNHFVTNNNGELFIAKNSISYASGCTPPIQIYGYIDFTV